MQDAKRKFIIARVVYSGDPRSKLTSENRRNDDYDFIRRGIFLMVFTVVRLHAERLAKPRDDFLASPLARRITPLLRRATNSLVAMFLPANVP